jgi:hypothetical protein
MTLKPNYALVARLRDGSSDLSGPQGRLESTGQEAGKIRFAE